MEQIISLLFYLSLVVFFMYLCKVRGGAQNKKNQIFIAYFVLFVVASIRYGIGNDYVTYAPDCTYVARWFQNGHSIGQGLSYFSDNVEIAHIIFCWLFQWMDYPFVGLYFIYSLIQVGLLFMILERENEHYWGLFSFIVCEFMFCSWDAIRQFTAVLIIVYSYYYVKKGRPFLFITCLCLAWLFHHSAIYTLPVFLLRWIKINRWILVAVLSTITILAVSGIIQQYQEQVSLFFDFSEYYSSYGSNNSFKVVAESQAYRIRLLMVGFFYVMILIFYPKNKNPLNELLLTMGASLFIFANNGLTLMRISWYFWLVAIIMIGPSFEEMKKKKLHLIRVGLISMVLFIFVHDVISGSNSRGCDVYTTIFTNDLNHLPQRDK